MTEKTWTIKELLQVTIAYLEEKEISDPRMSAEILLAQQLGIERLRLYLEYDRPLNRIEVNGYRDLIKRRLKREPVQYITGLQEFWSLDFEVNSHVLIPRPETELLIEGLLKFVKAGRKESTVSPSIAVLDLGTGSGAIAVAVASELKEAAVWASDICQGAVDMAAHNARRHGLEGRIHFLTGDLFEPVRPLNLYFDFILTNPPYVAAEDFDSLPPEVREYEPRIALDGHCGGLFYIEKIIREAPDFLNPGGCLLLEMDPRQVPRVLGSDDVKTGFKEKQVVQDYSRSDRVVILRKP